MKRAPISGSLWWWWWGEGRGGLCNAVKSPSSAFFLYILPHCVTSKCWGTQGGLKSSPEIKLLRVEEVKTQRIDSVWWENYSEDSKWGKQTNTTSSSEDERDFAKVTVKALMDYLALGPPPLSNTSLLSFGAAVCWNHRARRMWLYWVMLAAAVTALSHADSATPEDTTSNRRTARKHRIGVEKS